MQIIRKALCFIPFLIVLLFCGCTHIKVPATNAKTGEVEDIYLFDGGPVFVQESSAETISAEETNTTQRSGIYIMDTIEVTDEVTEGSDFFLFRENLRFVTPKDLSTEKNPRLIKILNNIHADREEGEPTLFLPFTLYSEW